MASIDIGMRRTKAQTDDYIKKVGRISRKVVKMAHQRGRRAFAQPF